MLFQASLLLSVELLTGKVDSNFCIHYRNQPLWMFLSSALSKFPFFYNSIGNSQCKESSLILLSFCTLTYTFLISLEREEAEDLIKSHGGRITSAVSRKTVRENY